MRAALAPIGIALMLASYVTINERTAEPRLKRLRKKAVSAILRESFRLAPQRLQARWAVSRI